MGEPKPEAAPAQTNGLQQLHKKPTTLNLSSGTSFYRPTPSSVLANGRLNDRRLQQQQRLAAPSLSSSSSAAPAAATPADHISVLKSALAAAAAAKPGAGLPSVLSRQLPPWADYEDQRESPPPPTPASSNPSPGHCNGHNGHFALYTPPAAPVPGSGSAAAAAAASSAGKVRSVPNGLPQPAPRRPHSIAASPAAAAAAYLHFGRPPRLSVPNGPVATTPSPAATANGLPSSYSWSTGLSNGTLEKRPPAPGPAGSAAAAPAAAEAPGPGVIGSCRQRPEGLPGLPPEQPPAKLAPPNRSAIPPQSLWNGQQPPRRPPAPLPAAAAAAAVANGGGGGGAESSSSSSVSSVSSAASSGPKPTGPANGAAAAANFNHKPPGPGAAATPAAAAARLAGEPVQWGPSGLVLHQPVARRAYPTTLPHPGSPPPASKGPGSLNSWATSSLHRRPHSIATTPVGSSDSGYRSLPSASSDYQLKSAVLRQQQQQDARAATAARRLSLPSAQNLLRAPRPSPTFHGFPSKPYVSPRGDGSHPLFLGCTHPGTAGSSPGSTASGSTRSAGATPVTSPAALINTYQAIQQLLAQQKNGLKLSDDKLNLFVDILDTQERFAQVSIFK